MRRNRRGDQAFSTLCLYFGVISIDVQICDGAMDAVEDLKGNNGELGSLKVCVCG